MLIFIAVVVALIGLSGMSRPLKIGVVLCMGLLIYCVYLYGGRADPARTRGSQSVERD